MIHTKEYSLSRKEYFQLILLNRFRSRWWLYCLTTCAGIYALINYQNSHLIWIIYAIVLPLLTVFGAYYFAYFTKSTQLFLPRKLSFEPSKITATLYGENPQDAPSTGEIAMNQIARKREFSNYWMLFLSNVNFIIIPKASFYSDEDRQAFKKMMKK